MQYLKFKEPSLFQDHKAQPLEQDTKTIATLLQNINKPNTKVSHVFFDNGTFVVVGDIQDFSVKFDLLFCLHSKEVIELVDVLDKLIGTNNLDRALQLIFGFAPHQVKPQMQPFISKDLKGVFTTYTVSYRDVLKEPNFKDLDFVANLKIDLENHFCTFLVDLSNNLNHYLRELNALTLFANKEFADLVSDIISDL